MAAVRWNSFWCPQWGCNQKQISERNRAIRNWSRHTDSCLTFRHQRDTIMFVIFIWFVIVQTSGHLHFQMVQSVRDIVVRHFTPGHILFVCYNTPAHSEDVSRDTPSCNVIVSPGHYTNHKMEKCSFNTAHTTEDLRQLIQEELNKIEA